MESLFAPGAVATLGARREDVFGAANLLHKELVIGRDMPQALSRALPQEAMQAMISGEGIEVARKGKEALHVAAWTTPLIMASNHFPDYVNTGGNVGRRLAVFYFERPVGNPDEGLLSNILASELPNIIARCLRAYDGLRHRVRAAGGGFWKSVPREMLSWQSRLASATNKLHAFIAMDEEERVTHEGANNNTTSGTSGGRRMFRLQLVSDDQVTCVDDFKSAYREVMNAELKDIDGSVLAAFGFRVSQAYENVCRSCRQLARARESRCCDAYNNSNRVRKRVIHGMQLTAVGL